MNAAPSTTDSSGSQSATRSTVVEWTIHRHKSVPSTNPIAGKLPAWNAVVSDIQTQGYGRTGRSWSSTQGGLWISAVLPSPPPADRWALIPLAAGCALAERLHSYGVQDLRLRWPNDLMIGNRKLGGLLVERYNPETIVVGFGINVLNEPAKDELALSGHTVSLSDLWTYPRSLFELSYEVLDVFSEMHRVLCTEGFAPFAEQIRLRWSRPYRVEVTRAGNPELLRGNFLGVDNNGRLILKEDTGCVRKFDATHVTLLRELAH